MKRAIIMLVAFLFGASLGYAESIEKNGQYPLVAKRTSKTSKRLASSEKRTATGKVIVSRDEVVFNDSSEALREGKEWSLVFEPIGFSVAPIASYGLAAGAYLSSDMIMEASYAHGKTDFLIFNIFSDYTALHLKKFWGNSFYTNTGFAMRKLGAGFDLESIATGASDLKASSSTTSIGVELAIGNRWQWDTFTLGCDWIGAFLPIAKISDDIDMPAGAKESEKKEAQDDWDNLAKTHNYQLLRFYLGVSI